VLAIEDRAGSRDGSRIRRGREVRDGIGVYEPDRDGTGQLTRATSGPGNAHAGRGAHRRLGSGMSVEEVARECNVSALHISAVLVHVTELIDSEHHRPIVG